MLGSPIFSMPSLSSCTSSRPSLFLSRRSNSSTSLFSSALGGSEAGLSSPLVAFPCICHSRGSQSPAFSRQRPAIQRSKFTTIFCPNVEKTDVSLYCSWEDWYWEESWEHTIIQPVSYNFTVLETRLGIRVRLGIVSTMFRKCAHLIRWSRVHPPP